MKLLLHALDMPAGDTLQFMISPLQLTAMGPDITGIQVHGVTLLPPSLVPSYVKPLYWARAGHGCKCVEHRSIGRQPGVAWSLSWLLQLRTTRLPGHGIYWGLDWSTGPVPVPGCCLARLAWPARLLSRTSASRDSSPMGHVQTLGLPNEGFVLNFAPKCRCRGFAPQYRCKGADIP